MIDGCHLKCHGRVLNKLVGQEKVVHFDALPLHKKFSKEFLLGNHVPEAERNQTARDVADKILNMLSVQGTI